MTGAEFWNLVSRDGKCWIWLGAADNHGHGVVKVKELGKLMKAHQAAWLLMGNKKLRKGQILHHVCRVRRCVNPEHLEISNRVHHPDSICGINAAKTHCPKGHPYDENNTYRWGDRKERKCLICHRNNCRNYYAKRRGLRIS